MNEETLRRPLIIKWGKINFVPLRICWCQPSKHPTKKPLVCEQCGCAIISEDELQKNPELKKYL